MEICEPGRRRLARERDIVGGVRLSAYLLLRVGPARDLHHHVQDGLLGIGVERDIVEGRDGLAVLLDVDAVLQGEGSTDLADAIAGGHGSWWGV